jgi:ERO1-like protein alpha
MAETDVGSVKGKEKGSGKRWILLIGAIAAVLLAVVVAVFLNTQNSSISEFTGKICNCRQAEQQKYIGIVEDCCCDYETVNRLNTEVLNPLLQDLVKTPFYRYFKVGSYFFFDHESI